MGRERGLRQTSFRDLRVGAPSPSSAGSWLLVFPFVLLLFSLNIDRQLIPFHITTQSKHLSYSVLHSSDVLVRIEGCILSLAAWTLDIMLFDSVVVLPDL